MEEIYMTSNERLNEHKIETNKIYGAIEDCIYKIRNFTENEVEIENIARTYRNKIYKIYTDLENKNIDFWDNDFELREPIIAELNAYMVIGAVLIEKMLDDLTKCQIKGPFKRVQHRLKIIKMQPTIDDLNRINDVIYNYNLKDDLNKTLIDYYQSLPEFFFGPTEIKQNYERVYNCIEYLDLSDSIENECLEEIIEYKEEKCLEHQRKLNKEKPMTRTRQKK